MLWTDSVFITPDDLFRIDSQVPNVAESQNINLLGTNGILRVAVEEAGMELQKRVVAFGGYLNSGDLSANHLAAVLNVGIGNSVRQKVTLDQVCVSGDVPFQWNWIKQWAAYWALASFYRNAFTRTVDDRYQKRMDYFRKEIDRRITPNLYGLGIPVVLRPLLSPGATFFNNSGSWDESNLSQVAGAGTFAESLDVAITYVDQSQPNLYSGPSSTGNAESSPSQVASILMTTGNVLSVDISTLNPPSGVQPPWQVLVCVVSLMKATGWNLYVGKKDGTLYLQNASPIPISTTSVTLPGDPTFVGHSAQLGQYASRRLTVVPTRQRS